MTYHSDNSKTDNVGDDYVEKTPNSVFRKKSLNRRLRRRLQRFLQKRKVLKAQQEIIELQKFSMICAVGNPTIPITGEESFVQLFLVMTGEAWALFVKLGGLILKFLKTHSTYLLKFIIEHPYFSLFTVYSSCGLLLLNHLAKKFDRKLRWFDRVMMLILMLLTTWLTSAVIKAEAFKTILEWFKSILIQVIVSLRTFNSRVDSYFSSSTDLYKDKPKPENAGEFKTFVFFSILTTLTTGYLLYAFKRHIVGDGSFIDDIIYIIDRYRSN